LYNHAAIPYFPQHRRDLVEGSDARVHFYRLVEAVGVGGCVTAPAAFAHHDSCFFYGLLLLENSSVKSAFPPVMEPLHSDAACPILLGPLSGPAAGG
jgi:hypothetical protein